MNARLRSLSFLAALLATALIPAAAQAQAAAPARSATLQPAALVSGVPTLQASRVALRPIAAADRAEAPSPMVQGSPRRGKTLMIVGGAMFIAGAIIGDDAGTIVMLGGAGIGLYGLYLFVQ